LGGCAGGAVLGSGDGICEIEKKRRITQRRRDAECAEVRREVVFVGEFC
jgi:hypothetical protein